MRIQPQQALPASSGSYPRPNMSTTINRSKDCNGDSELYLTIAGVEYLLILNSHNILAPLKIAKGDDYALAVAYENTAGRVVDGFELRSFRQDILAKDDCFQPEFCRHVIFYGKTDRWTTLATDALDELSRWSTVSHTCINGVGDTGFRPGPYVYAHGRTWQPWRVYPLDAPIAGTNGRVVVPPRSYFKPSPSKPLDGARITVKDNIDIAGHKTTLCNMAWMDLYPEKTKTAACIETLIAAGAIIIGKVKLQAMIMREEPLECVEFAAPFNPRADGYQVPSGSSHASAAGVASYDWLDFSIGSDTNGSGRKPASYNGCFSIRPTTGILDVDGVVGQFPLFDMPVFFGRDSGRFSDFITAWYGKSPMLKTPAEKLVKILYPLDYLPTINSAQTALIDRFVVGLETATGHKRTEISLSQLWAEELPDGPANADLSAYLELTGGYPYYYDSYHDLAKFRDEYSEKHGKPPFVHRAMHWQWDISKTITKEQRDLYWRRSELYRDWLLKRVFHADDESTHTIMVFPIELGRPNYRDSVPPPFAMLSGYASLNMSPMMRAPEVTVPVGDIPYQSLVTEREESLPIAASIIGAPGNDLIIVELVKRGMLAAGIPTKVKTGRSMH